MSTPYSPDFFRRIQGGAFESAREVVPLLLDLVHPASVIDVGCGTGAWLCAFLEAGVPLVTGVDGDYVPRHELLIPAGRFLARDLTAPLNVGFTADLALCLEVAEHLHSPAGDLLVESLAQLAPVVAFSAAVPNQGGTHHVNEQWPAYWAARFERLDYLAADCLRLRIWNNPRVHSWYRQNLVLYVRRDALPLYPALEAARTQVPNPPLPLVHPDLFHARTGFRG